MKSANRLLLFVFIFYLPFTCFLGACTADPVWRKGNMHAHTFWSDGTHFPEPVAAWYKENGYDFLVFTDHNIIHEVPEKPRRPAHSLIDGKLWQRLAPDNPALGNYLGSYGENWVDIRPGEEEGELLVRLRTYEEYNPLFDEPGRFMIMMGNELTNPHVHFLAFDQERELPVARGNANDRVRMIRETVENLQKYREETGKNTFPVLAHPNHRWSITAEMMLEVPELRFFEVYNGIPGTMNEGDGYRAGTEQMWDIVLAFRLSNGNAPILYGLATDDAHHYLGQGSGPGRGWVMVNAPELKTESILDALDKGDFYSSTGVSLKKIQFNGKTLRVEIEPQEGVEYITEFIGTREGFDPSSVPTVDALGMEIENTTRTYSEDIGEVLTSSRELKSSYTFTGDELYVRVKVTSSADQIDPINGSVLGKQVAWVQPHINGQN